MQSVWIHMENSRTNGEKNMIQFIAGMIAGSVITALILIVFIMTND